MATRLPSEGGTGRQRGKRQGLSDYFRFTDFDVLLLLYLAIRERVKQRADLAYDAVVLNKAKNRWWPTVAEEWNTWPSAVVGDEDARSGAELHDKLAGVFQRWNRALPDAKLRTDYVWWFAKAAFAACNQPIPQDYMKRDTLQVIQELAAPKRKAWEEPAYMVFAGVSTREERRERAKKDARERIYGSREVLESKLDSAGYQPLGDM